MKHVKIIRGGVTGLSGPLKVGEIYYVEDEKAETFVEGGYAVIIKPPKKKKKVKTAVAKVTKKAVRRKDKKRKKK